MPWLFAQPSLHLGEWQNRLHRYLEEFRFALSQSSLELQNQDLHSATRARLTVLSTGYATQIQAVSQLLEPLAIHPSVAAAPVLEAFGARLPRSQDLHSYYVNLHRDWAWGDEESALSLSAVLAAIPSAQLNDPTLRVLILGAGGCRLARDLHQASAWSRTIALDINPLLFLVAQKVLNGESVSLCEFPIAPRELNDHARMRVLQAPGPTRDGLELVFADACDAPFAAQQFDLIITPWLIDIISDPLPSFAARMNRLLREGGRWVNFGSVSFTANEPQWRWGSDEVRELLHDQGFRIDYDQNTILPYMRSPASRHSRLEEVWTLGLQKTHTVAAPLPAEVLPAWLRDPTVPIPKQASLDLTATASRLQAFALTLIDGQRCAADLARFLVEQQLLGPESALAAVRGLLLRVYESARCSAP